jgi:hypothetical protein
MPSRKKRAKKSIESLEEQIRVHERKRATTDIHELKGYYDKEIENLKEALEKKKKITKR